MKRRMHKLWARLWGYFWLPCDRCGFEFGGHQKGWQARGLGHPDLLCRVCLLHAEFWEQMVLTYGTLGSPKTPDPSKGPGLGTIVAQSPGEMSLRDYSSVTNTPDFGSSD